MNRLFVSASLGVAALLLAGSGKASAATLLGIGLAPNTNAPTVFSVDRTTGEATAVGPLGSATSQPFGLAVSGGTLYTFDGSTDTIRKIDPLTGSFTGAPITIGIGNLNGEGDIAFSLNGATGYITTANNSGTGIAPALYSFNLANGTSALIGTTRDEIGPITVDGFAFNPSNGLLYAITDADDRLYTLNAATGLLTAVGPLGVSPNGGFGALTIDTDTGALLAAINDSLYSINPVTGAATAIPPSGFGTDFGSVSGLAPVIPEPSTFALVGLASAAIALRRKRLQA